MLTPNPIQTTYTQYINIGQVGMPASTINWITDTRIAEDITSSANGIGFGLAVSQSFVTDRGACLGQLSGGVFVGITRADTTLPNVVSGFTDVYNEGDNMGVMVQGDIWVVAANTVAAGAEAFFNSVTGQLGVSGIANGVAITNSRWMTSAPLASTDLMFVETGHLAVLRIGAVPA